MSEERPQARAVALGYDPLTKRAPRVVAKGRGAAAEQIVELAFANGVRVREDADLAELLQAVDLDSPIPLEAFAAVAEIVSFLYRENAAWGESPARFTAEAVDPDSPALPAIAPAGAYRE